MDLIIYNGKIHTNDDKNPIVQAMAIEKGIIKYIGDNEVILKLKKDKTELIDLNKMVVIPGLNDSHLHLYKTGEFLTSLSLMGKTSINEIKKEISLFITNKNKEREEWIIGHGWNEEFFLDNKTYLTKSVLDQVSSTHPIALYRACGHLMVANSKALKLAKIDETIISVKDGSIDFERGLLFENAINLMTAHFPEPTVNELKEVIKVGLYHANSLGLTSLHTDDFIHSSKTSYKNVIQAYHELNSEGSLTCRIYQQCLLPNLELLNQFLDEGFVSGMGNSFYKIGPLKLLSDGSLGGRTAALENPYKDDPTNYGMLIYEDEKIYELIKKAHKSGMQIAVHSIGDRAINQILDTFEQVLKDCPHINHRHQIVHLQITNNSIFKKMKELNLTALVQPIFINTDHRFVAKRVGDKLAKTSYAFKTLIENDIPTALCTDSPIESLNPFYNIYAAVTRKDLNGLPNGGWFPEENLSVSQAVYHYTYLPSYASFEEDKKGKLIPNHFADFIVIDTDIYNCNPNEIPNTKVIMTVVDGKTVYTNTKQSS